MTKYAEPSPFPADFMALSRDLIRRQEQREKERPIVREGDPRKVKADGEIARNTTTQRRRSRRG